MLLKLCVLIILCSTSFSIFAIKKFVSKIIPTVVTKKISLPKDLYQMLTKVNHLAKYSSDNSAPLHFATGYYGNLALVQHLVDTGSDVNAKTIYK